MGLKLALEQKIALYVLTCFTFSTADCAHPSDKRSYVLRPDADCQCYSDDCTCFECFDDSGCEGEFECRNGSCWPPEKKDCLYHLECRFKCKSGEGRCVGRGCVCD